MTSRDMAKFIYDQEVRRDKTGRPMIYELPSNDGGGKFEFAGICERYHPKAAAELLQMLNEGKTKEAEDYAISYIEDQTNPVKDWSSVPAVELFLRDTAFNRGVMGCARILQMALRVVADGSVGPKTRAALRKAEVEPRILLVNLRKARENYEVLKVGYRSNLWPGLVARWNHVLFEAKKIV